MTSQKDQIQALITDIDSVLQKTTPRLPWVVSGEMTQQRQILERVRNYLVTFQRRQMAGEGFEPSGARPDLLAHDIYYQPAQGSYQSPQAGAEAERSLPYGQSEAAAQQMLQALAQEMGYLRSNLMQPLQSDVEMLRQQREALVQEIRQLEAQRQGYAGQLPGQQQVIAEFLQALMTRLQETLPQQVAQSLRSSNQQQSLPYGANLALTGSAPVVAPTSDAPYPGLGNIQVPQSQSDELLIKLDSTLSVVFESLQRNVQAYEESLSQGLNKMHSLGQQGEMMFTALISHLAGQLGQEASSYLQPSTLSSLDSARGTLPLSRVISRAAQTAQSSSNPSVPSFLEQPNASASPNSVDTVRPLALPFPGTELSSNVPADAATTPPVAEPVDSAIDSWLRSAGSVEGESTVDLEIAELNLEGFDLNQLAAQDVNALLELDANLLGTNLPPQPILAPEPSAISGQPNVAEPSFGETSVEDTADIDAALKLLEQLSSELQEQPTSVADADAQIDRMLSSPSTLPSDTTTDSIPDDAKDELDEFYESLFGNQTIAAEPSTAEQVATQITDTPAVESPVVETPVTDASISTDQAFLTADAIAPSDTQPQAQSLDVPSSTLQPINTLPAEAQAPKEALAEAVVVPPSVSTSADPTLGWDLLGKATDPLAEPDIPAALLEDELLDGWDLDDAEVDLDALDMPPAGDDPLGLGDAVVTGDRQTNDLPPFDDAAIAPSEPQSLVAEPTSEVVSEAVSDSPSGAGDPQPHDEIATLTDLFDETPPPEEVSLEAPIEASAETPSQSLPVPPANVSPVVLPVPTAGTLPSEGAGGDRLTEDRYTPASPEEDLLPLQAVEEEPDPELWLDESTLNRLSEDLFNLEDAIGDPSDLSYVGEPQANQPAFFADPTVTDEPAPGDSTSLEDWSAALDEGSSVLPPPPPQPPEVNQGAIAAQPDAFILEGMDDLFANTPTEPPVVPIAPPVSPPAEPSTAFTLEGMSDLFADPLADTTPLTPTLPTASQPLPFTLEGMDDLFGDVPGVPSEPLPSTPTETDQPLPFTLDGVDSLFADVPPVADTPPAPEVAPTTPPQEPAASTAAFSFEQVGNLFVEVPSAEVPSTNIPTNIGIQEPIAPPVEQSLEPSPVAPFTLEQVGGLFIEKPSEASPVLNVRSTEEAASLTEPFSEAVPTPFSLEQVGDLFADSSLEDPALDLTTPPILQPPSLEPEKLSTESSQPDLSSAEPATLEQAFASLMGAFDEPISPASDDRADSQDPEKKKGMS
ncbi:MAG: hypothetical protein KME45_04055 [Stenomitos rutilans HA7619-LM2]|nr:hypothetical protein [Stenomitos rutilans HA7619-LM2]